MGAAIALRNVVGEAQNVFVVAIVPLHGHFHTNAGAGNAAIRIGWTLTQCNEGVGVQHFFIGVDKVNKTFDTAGARKVVFLACALVFQSDAHTVVQEAEFAQTLGQYFVMKIVVLREDVGVGQKVNFGAALFSSARDFHGRHFNAVDHFKQAVLHETFGKFNLMDFAFAAHGEAQPLAERIHATHAHAV